MGQSRQRPKERKRMNKRIREHPNTVPCITKPQENAMIRSGVIPGLKKGQNGVLQQKRTVAKF
jgi:hypothetical protein